MKLYKDVRYSNNNSLLRTTKENVAKMIRKVFSLEKSYHILVTDDGSPDGTADIVKGLQEEYSSNLFIEERSGKLGLGTAYIHGFQWGLERAYEYFIEMDCDFSHNSEDLIRLYQTCAEDGYDLAIVDMWGLGQRNQLANWKGIDVVFCFSLCKVYYRFTSR